ncbi:uncharacterized protein LOC133915411 isoform X1 [Phragmites australis]|uniref:uncharacterized protein LOC133915411 isoform X1 n=1 Tax=Phragmites australis TaxID=29695 RepID=UPI002D770581|nr:uncharacterized protein LOC133915411 isoform X1 [Phragmites australis]
MSNRSFLLETRLSLPASLTCAAVRRRLLTCAAAPSTDLRRRRPACHCPPRILLLHGLPAPPRLPGSPFPAWPRAASELRHRRPPPSRSPPPASGCGGVCGDQARQRPARPGMKFMNVERSFAMLY